MIALRQDSEKNVYKLNIFTLGRFEMCRQDKGIYNSSARSTKQWELFKFLLTHSGKGVAPETILENLYPADTYENPKNTLQNNVYRLRKILVGESFFNGCNYNILFFNGCYSLSATVNIGLDTDIFEENVQIADFYKYEDPEEAILHYENALRVYGGDYLPELGFADWVIPKRNYYRRQYINSVLHLAQLYKQKKAYDDCIRTCEKALQIEPYDEEINISFMDALTRMGRINEAQKHYGYITSALYKQFGIKPSIEMQNIYQMFKDISILQRKDRRNEELYSDENSEGAFYCDSKTFRSLFILEKRRSERTGDDVFLISLSLDKPPDENINIDTLQDLKKVLVHSLRKGDVVTIWNESQLLFMLPKIQYRQIKTVTDGIIKKFEDVGDYYKDQRIKVGIYTFLP